MNRLYKSVLLSLAGIFITLTPLFSQAKQEKKSDAGRPKIALVLSGGGAKGLAEIPLIEALEDEGIPVDMVLGTSMGSMIGALYAAGYTPGEIRSIFTSLDIMTILNTSAVATQKLSQKAYAAPTDNIFSLNFTWSGLGAAPALLGDQNIMNMLSRYFSRLTNDLDFDELPRQFRAIATNVTTAEKVIFSHGSIVDAIRGSMSLPAIWTPAIVDRETFVIDGGWVDNLPIQVARDMGADIVIAMDVASFQEDDPLNIDSINSIAVNLFNLTISTNALAQHEKANLLLRPDLTEYSTLDFFHAEEIIKAGETCVRENRNQIRRLVNELEKLGVNLEPMDYKRPSEYSKLPDFTIEAVKVRDVSFREPCPLPKESDFQSFIGKKLDEKTKTVLIDKLNDYQVAYSLSSLWFAVLPGSTSESCVLEIQANHYAQNSNRIIFGGTPSVSTCRENGKFGYDLNPTIYTSIYLSSPLPMMASFFTGETTGSLVSLQPKIAVFDQYEICADFQGSVFEGSLEPKSSPFYENRTANDDMGLNVLTGIQIRYANMFTFSTNFQYDLVHLHSSAFTYNMFSLHTDTIWTTLDSLTSLRGIKAQFMYAMALSPNLEEFLYQGRIGYEQRIELLRGKNALGYSAELSLNHFPWQFNSGYNEYGGFKGMPGYSFGTKVRDFSMVGLDFTQHLFNVAGMPLYIYGQAKAGIRDTYSPYTASEAPSDSIFDGWNPLSIDSYDFGAGTYLILKSPLGNIVMGAGGAVNGNWCFILGIM